VIHCIYIVIIHTAGHFVYRIPYLTKLTVHTEAKSVLPHPRALKGFTLHEMKWPGYIEARSPVQFSIHQLISNKGGSPIEYKEVKSEYSNMGNMRYPTCCIDLNSAVTWSGLCHAAIDSIYSKTPSMGHIIDQHGTSHLISDVFHYFVVVLITTICILASYGWYGAWEC